MGPKKQRKKRVGTATAAAAPPAAAVSPPTASSTPKASLQQVSDTIDLLLTYPDSELVQNHAGLAELEDLLSEVLPATAELEGAAPAAADAAGAMATKAFLQLQLPHLIAKVLAADSSSSSSSTCGGQTGLSKWQQADYCNVVLALLQATNHRIFPVTDLIVCPLGQQQPQKTLEAAAVLLQSGVLQQATLAQQQLADLLQQQQQQQQPAPHLSGKLLCDLVSYSRCVSFFVLLLCNQPQATATLNAAVRAGARLSTLMLQHSDRLKWGAGALKEDAIQTALDVARLAEYAKRSSATLGPGSSSSGGGGGGCSSSSSGCITADAAVLRLMCVLLAVYGKAFHQQAHGHSSSGSSNSSSSSKPPVLQEGLAAAAAAAAAVQPRSLLQLTEELWAACLQQDPQQQQQQGAICLQRLATALHSSGKTTHRGMPSETLQQLLVCITVSLEDVSTKLAPLDHLNSSSSSTDTDDFDELVLLLQRAAWPLPPLLTALGAAFKGNSAHLYVYKAVQATNHGIDIWIRTGQRHWVCEYNRLTDAGRAASDPFEAAEAAAAASAPAPTSSAAAAATVLPGVQSAASALESIRAERAGLGEQIWCWLSGLLHCWVQMADRQTTLLAADLAAAFGGSSSSSGGSSGVTGSSSFLKVPNIRAHISVLDELFYLVCVLRSVYATANPPDLRPYLPDTNPWQEHNVAVAAVLETVLRILHRHTLLASSNSSTTTQQQQQQQQRQGEREGEKATVESALQFLRRQAQMVVRVLIKVDPEVEGAPLSIGAVCCPSHGFELRQQLFSLAVSDFKLGLGEWPLADVECARAVSQCVLDSGEMLAERLEDDYSLAAVRAAVAPWLVLLGRLYRLMGDVLSAQVAAATQLLSRSDDSSGEGGECDESADQLLTVISKVIEVTVVSMDRMRKKLGACFDSAEATQYKGQRQYPDPDAVGDTHHRAHGGSSSGGGGGGAGAVRAVPAHHLQHPGLAVEAVIGSPAATTVGAAAAGASGSSSTSSSSSSTRAVVDCVLLDDLDSWLETSQFSSLFNEVVAAQNTIFIQYSGPKAAAENPDRLDFCAQLTLMLHGPHSPEGHPSSLQILSHIIRKGVLQRLAPLLHAAGTSLCTCLPVPWCCNNPGCVNMGCDSEVKLVGGKACCCAGCKVARYCGRACQAAHWKQHKPVCKRLAARAAAAASAADHPGGSLQH